MEILDLPVHRTSIVAPCDVIRRATGKDERVSVAFPIEVPLDRGAELATAARFQGIWPLTRFTFGHLEGRDNCDADYLRCGDALLAPIQVLGFKHMFKASVTREYGRFELRNHDAFVDLALTADDPDGLLLSWSAPHRVSGARNHYSGRDGTLVLNDDFRGMFEFDRSFSDRIRRFVRANFVMRSEGLFARMPLPSWRLHDGMIGLDPRPMKIEGWTNSFRLDRLAEVHRMAEHFLGRKAAAAIAAPASSVVHLDDVPSFVGDDLGPTKRAVTHLLSEAAPLLPQLARTAVLDWHAAIAESLGTDAQQAEAFVRFSEAVEAAPASVEGDAWLKRSAGLRWRL
ncbi:hypothetical protein ACFPYM_13165, partial [Methylobacterium hispanicum]